MEILWQKIQTCWLTLPILKLLGTTAQRPNEPPVIFNRRSFGRTSVLRILL